MHLPVMLEEAIQLLNCRAGGTYIDCTLGEGGHSQDIMKKIGNEGTLIAIDQDADVIIRAKEKLTTYSGRIKYFNSNFVELRRILDELKLSKVDGIIFDLGLSSFQLSDFSRGFSFMNDGPLDMRMSRQIDETAMLWVNRLDEESLSNVIFKYGEERWSRRIARAIVREREKAEIKTTFALAGIVRRAIPGKRGRLHPATRTFQALRILVNNEIEAIEKAIPAAINSLNDGGRICVISFHSLEDRVIKNTFKDFSRREEQPFFRILTRKPATPSIEEVRNNPRSRSAKMRAGEVFYG